MDRAKWGLETVQLVLKVVQDLRTLSDSVHAVCDKVMEGLSEQQPKAIPEKTGAIPVKKKPTLKLEDVRGVLAEKSRDGFTADIREILKKHGADKLSAVDPKEYEAILEEAEGLKHE